MVVNPPPQPTITNMTDWNRTDMTYLNVQENMNQGKGRSFQWENLER